MTGRKKYVDHRDVRLQLGSASDELETLKVHRVLQLGFFAVFDHVLLRVGDFLFDELLLLGEETQTGFGVDDFLL